MLRRNQKYILYGEHVVLDEDKGIFSYRNIEGRYLNLQPTNDNLTLQLYGLNNRIVLQSYIPKTSKLNYNILDRFTLNLSKISNYKIYNNDLFDYELYSKIELVDYYIIKCYSLSENELKL